MTWFGLGLVVYDWLDDISFSVLKVYDWLDEVEGKSAVMSQEVIGSSVEGRPIRVVKVDGIICSIE